MNRLVRYSMRKCGTQQRRLGLPWPVTPGTVAIILSLSYCRTDGFSPPEEISPDGISPPEEILDSMPRSTHRLIYSMERGQRLRPLPRASRSEEHTSELQSLRHLVC